MWITRDPIGEMGGLNLYAFVGNNPVNLIDPLGLKTNYGEVFVGMSVMVSGGFKAGVSGALFWIGGKEAKAGKTVWGAIKGMLGLTHNAGVGGSMFAMSILEYNIGVNMVASGLWGDDICELKSVIADDRKFISDQYQPGHPNSITREEYDKFYNEVIMPKNNLLQDYNNRVNTLRKASFFGFDPPTDIGSR